MLAKRIIPCLDVKDGRVVKGINFQGLQDVGDAVELGRRYALEGADELVYLDISATLEGRNTFAVLVSRVAEAINIPFTVGGGIRSLDDASRLLDAGADKITLNSAAIARPQLIEEIASKYGRQFVVVAIDAKSGPDGRWMATTHGGSRPTDKELFSWAKEAQERGAGRPCPMPLVFRLSPQAAPAAWQTSPPSLPSARQMRPWLPVSSTMDSTQLHR